VDFNQLARDFGPLAAGLAAVIATLTGTFKIILPRLADAFIEDRKVQREEERAESAADRQNEIALLSQVIQLSSQVQAENKDLIAYITGTLRVDLQTHRSELLTTMRDINERWTTLGREMAAGNAKIQILTTEVAQLSDRFAAVDQTLRAALNGPLSRSKRSEAARTEHGKAQGAD
jgi:chromosome segregation ATPase